MQWVRNLILVGLAIVSYLLILAWQKDYGNRPGVSGGGFGCDNGGRHRPAGCHRRCSSCRR
jgi:hypothetical protein